jgi:hypothetical protein
MINTLKYFLFLVRIRRAITEYMFVQRYAAWRWTIVQRYAA